MKPKEKEKRKITGATNRVAKTEMKRKKFVEVKKKSKSNARTHVKKVSAKTSSDRPKAKGKSRLKTEFDSGDEEIDEDCAFNSSDEEKYGEFIKSYHDDFNTDDTSNQTIQNEEYDSGDAGSEVMFLSDNLDAVPKEKVLPNVKGVSEKSVEIEKEQINVVPGDLSVQYESDGSEARSDISNSQHANLMNLVNTLEDNSNVQKLRKSIHISYQNLDPSEFGTISSKKLTTGLTLDDLLGELGGTKGLSHIKDKVRKFIRNAAPPSAPVSEVVEARADREVAYNQVTQDMDKWTTVVKEERSRKVADFRKKAIVPKQTLSSSALVSKFKPDSEMEKEIEKLLRCGGTNDDLGRNRKRYLEAKKFTTDEVAARNHELAKMRALSRYEIEKRTRIKKIKSKMYRKIRNRKLRRESDHDIQDMMEQHPDLLKELEAKELKKRAEERITLRHTNTSKWVKKVIKRGYADARTKSAVAEQLALQQELMKRQVREETSSESEDEEELCKELDIIGNENDPDLSIPKKGLFGMSFMQRGIERQAEAARMAKEQMLKEFDEDDSIITDTDDEQTSRNTDKHVVKKSVISDRSNELDENILQNFQDGSLQANTTSVRKGATVKTSGNITIDPNVMNLASQNILEVSDESTDNENTEFISFDTKNGASNVDSEILEQPETFDVTNPWLSDRMRGIKAKVKPNSSDQEKAMKLVSDTIKSAEKLNKTLQKSKASNKETQKVEVNDHFEVKVKRKRAKPKNANRSDIGAHGTAAVITINESDPLNEEEENMKAEILLKKGKDVLNSALIPRKTGNTVIDCSNQIKSESEVEEQSVEKDKQKIASKSKLKKATKASQNGLLSIKNCDPSEPKKDRKKEKMQSAVKKVSTGNATSTASYDSSSATEKQRLVKEKIKPTSQSNSNGRENDVNHGNRTDGRKVSVKEENEKKRLKSEKNIDGALENPLGLSQEELLSRAFVTMNFEKEFEDAKDAQIEDEISKTVPKTETMKGWGSWTGLGTKPPVEPKWLTARREKEKNLAEAARASRPDAKLPKVIINSKRILKSATLKLEKVPFPYTSKGQYEKSIERPLGPEWNTPLGIAELTQPNAIFEAGMIIDPIKQPKRVNGKHDKDTNDAEEKTERLTKRRRQVSRRFDN